ncbi:MAG: phosphatase PAP2 family protein [Hyphomicrobiales bacterium]
MSHITDSGLERPFSARQTQTRLFAASLLAHTPFLVLVVLYALIVLVAYSYVGVSPGRSALDIFFATAAVAMPVILLSVIIIEFYRMVRYERPKHPIPTLLRRVKAFFFKDSRWALGLPLLFILQPFIAFFTDLKGRIPAFVPYSWDPTFDELDRIIHFGTRPWEWLQPLIGYAPITFLINLNYNLWFFAMWIFWAWFAWQEKPGVNRTRAFLSFLLIWMFGGSLLAIVFSSAGPCYFSRLGLSPDPYAPLMSYLRGVNEVFPIWAVDTQNALWDGYVHGGLIQGISAMPSMHNATALLFVLASWHLGRVIRALTIGHMLLIFIGSVHLGWHYAVDAYLAWALTLVVWFAAKPLAAWWEARPPAQRLALAMEQQSTCR